MKDRPGSEDHLRANLPILQRLGWVLDPLTLRNAFTGAVVSRPVADQLTRGAFLGPWRLMSIDGFEWDAPDTKENVAAFGFSVSSRPLRLS